MNFVQGLWYGDRRDRVKWGALIYLAEARSIHRIVQVAYYRAGGTPILHTPDGEIPLSQAVWHHFSDLNHVKSLGLATGTDIVVIDEPFNHQMRAKYVAGVVRQLKMIESPKIVFLDPDTGVQPHKAGPEHVTSDDITTIWASLSTSDVLVVYQHADRTTTWREKRAETMRQACGSAHVEAIIGEGVASDVAMLCCEKGIDNHRSPQG